MAKSQRSKSTVSQSQRSKSTLVNGLVNVLVNDDISRWRGSDVSKWRGNDDVTRADVSKRNLARDSVWKRVGARDGAWRRVEDPGGAWSAWDLVQNFLAMREGAWQLRWWSGFHKQLDRRKRISVVPAKTQSEQGSRRRRSGSGLETTNDGGCRSGTRDNDWNASEV